VIKKHRPFKQPAEHAMPEKPRSFEPISVNSERDMRQHMRAICQRFNDNPHLARLVLVNPILALEDVGVQLAPEIKDHIMQALRFPPRLEERKAELETDIKAELAKLKVPAELPLTPARRSQLLFQVLKLPPLSQDAGEVATLESHRTRAYSRMHPLVAKLAEYERLRQGGLVFHPRKTYEDYKAGRRRHHWVKSLRFKI
jgi:hypothetical protein